MKAEIIDPVNGIRDLPVWSVDHPGEDLMKVPEDGSSVIFLPGQPLLGFLEGFCQKVGSHELTLSLFPFDPQLGHHRGPGEGHCLEGQLEVGVTLPRIGSILVRQHQLGCPDLEDFLHGQG